MASSASDYTALTRGLIDNTLHRISLLQVDSTPDRPAPGELREKSTPAKSAGTPIEGMIMGANSNSYLRRGATFDVMRNVEAGVEDTGELLCP